MPELSFEDIFNCVDMGVVVLDERGVVLFLNPAGAKLLGADLPTALQRPFTQLVRPTDRARAALLLREIERGSRILSADLEIEAGTSRRTLSVGTTSLHAPANRTLVTLRDVTEERTVAAELRETKEFLERLIDSSVDGIAACDMAGRILLFNNGAERITGFSAAHVRGHFVGEFYPGGQAEEIMRLLRSQEHGGLGRLTPLGVELLGASGEHIPVRLSAAIVSAGGREVATVAIFTDLRERKRIDAALEAAQKDLIEAQKRAAVTALAGATAHELNQPLTTVLGFAELLESRLDESDRNRHTVAAIREAAETMRTLLRKIASITRVETKDYVQGKVILDVERSATPAPNVGAEHVLRTLPAAAALCDHTLTIVAVNERFAEILGTPAAHLVQRPLVEVLPAKRGALPPLRESGEASYEALHTTGAIRVRLVERGAFVAALAEPFDAGRVAELVVSLGRELNAFATPDEIIDAVFRTMRELYSGHCLLIRILDPQTLTVAAERSIGPVLPEGRGRLALKPSSAERLRLDLARLPADRLHFVTPLPPAFEGSVQSLVVPLVAGGALYGLITVESTTAQDDALLRAEPALLQIANQAATALRALRSSEDRLARAAHEMTSPLTTVALQAESLARQETSDPALAAKLRNIAEASEHVLKLSRQVMQSARPPREGDGGGEVHAALEQALRFCDHVLVDRHIQIVRTLEPGPLRVRANATDLVRVFVNLISNAADAVSAGGRVEVTTRLEETTVFCTIRDNGQGMDAVTAARAFEPYFTTKSSGRGTGLGLPIVKGLIEDCGGTIALETVSGVGTTFTLLLPAL